MAADREPPDLLDASARARRSGRSGLPPLIGLAALALLIAGAMAWTILDQRGARRHGTANSDAMRALTAVQIDMLDAETGQRGYLLTGDVEYLQPYTAAGTRIAADLRAAEAALHGSGADAERLAPLRRLIGTRLAELDRTIALAKAGRRTEAVDFVQSNVGKRTMDSFRQAAGRMIEDHMRKREAAIARINRNDTLLLPLQLALGAAVLALVVAGFGNERRRARAMRVAQRAAQLRRANDRNELLLRELNHRVKNIFSVIMAIIALAARRQPGSGQLADDIRGRVHALALAHSASLGEVDVDAVPLRAVLDRALEPYRGEDRITLEGDELSVPVRAVTPLGLIVHELATNAVKHGSLSMSGGAVEIGWNVTSDGKIEMRWIESLPAALSGRIAAPERSGFGTTMIDLAARQLNGSVSREWRAGGLALALTFEV